MAGVSVMAVAATVTMEIDFLISIIGAPFRTEKHDGGKFVQFSTAGFNYYYRL